MLLALLAPAALAQEAWYIGAFAGVMGEGDERMAFSVKCEPSGSCETALQVQAPKPEKPFYVRTTKARTLPIQIPNNNLRHTREAVKRDPSAYDSKRDGALLRQLRPLLESEAQFDACMDVADDPPTYVLFCRLDREVPGMPVTVLMPTTMYPTCGGQVFCAYFFFPARRADGAQSQSDMNRQAGQRLADAAVDLGRAMDVYRRRLDEKQRALFDRSYEQWQKHRDASCEFEASGVAGGSAHPMVHAECLARYTRERVGTLQRLSTCKEGDLSCPARLRPTN